MHLQHIVLIRYSKLICHSVLLFILYQRSGIKVTSSQSSEFEATAVSPEEIQDPHVTAIDEEAHGDDSYQFQEVHVKPKASAKLSQDLAPVRGSVYCLPSPVDDKTCILLHDALKILFNQTLGWVDKNCEGVSRIIQLVYNQKPSDYT